MSTKSIAQNQELHKTAIRQAKLNFLKAVDEGTPEEYEAHQADFYHWLAQHDPALLTAIQSTWPGTFYSVCAHGSGVMFSPVPPKRRR